MVEQSPAASSAATMMRYDANKKSLAVSYLLWFFVGMLGGHRFYHGRTGTAVVQLVLFIVGVATYIFLIGIPILAAVGIWALMDAFFIPGWVRSYNNQLASSLGG